MANYNPNIYIVIPVFNRLDTTRECLESLRLQSYRYFHVVVVDDGSTDGTADFIGKYYPEISLLKGDGQLWWTGATNLAVEYALKFAGESDYILTLNNDTLLPTHYLETIISLARETPNGLIGSIALDYNRRDVRVNAGVRVDWFSARFTKINLIPGEETDSFYSVSFLSGRGTLIPVRVFERIGLYDARAFPHYAADYDFSLRAKRVGYTLVLHPRCYLYSKTNLTGISNLYNKVSFMNWLKSFSSIRSSNNLKIRIRFGLRHPPILCRPTFIVCDLLRITLGTLRNQVKNMLKPV
jgi:GT2 family glycosyltransferase